MRPSGEHTHPAPGSGLAAVLAAIAGAALVAAPASYVLAGLLHAVVVTVIAATAVVAVALAVAITICLRRHRLPQPGQPSQLITPPARPVTTALPHQRAVCAPAVHLHLHGITAENVAAALAYLPVLADPPEGRLTGHVWQRQP